MPTPLFFHSLMSCRVWGVLRLVVWSVRWVRLVCLVRQCECFVLMVLPSRVGTIPMALPIVCLFLLSLGRLLGFTIAPSSYILWPVSSGTLWKLVFPKWSLPMNTGSNLQFFMLTLLMMAFPGRAVEPKASVLLAVWLAHLTFLCMKSPRSERHMPPSLLTLPSSPAPNWLPLLLVGMCVLVWCFHSTVIVFPSVPLSEVVYDAVCLGVVSYEG